VDDALNLMHQSFWDEQGVARMYGHGFIFSYIHESKLTPDWEEWIKCSVVSAGSSAIQVANRKSDGPTSIR
jgi:hypothetical protein